MKKTPLYEKHVDLKGKIIDFGGWSLPVEYQGILVEHEAVRNAAGLFDVSHMGEVMVTGPDAEKYIQKMIVNDISKQVDFQIFYAPMCYPDGGVVDDLLVYRYNKEKYLLVINASNIDKDVKWLQDHVDGQVEITDLSETYGEVALQGPKSQAILETLTDTKLNDLAFYHFLPEIEIGGISAMVSRTGYTGEDGFEIYVDPLDATFLWDLLLEAGKDQGLIPAGLGARDTLRFEVCLPLYGHELSKAITPLEAGLGGLVKFDKGDFIGREALLEQKDLGVKRTLVGFEMIDRGIARNSNEVYIDGEIIGFVTTGSFAPSLKKNVGMALIDAKYALEGGDIYINVRDKQLKARIIKKPFYEKNYKK
ncbi:MAG: glycine cleavage system aminomethyltransferase GcvT [Anaerovoracaceae bacterium]|jgi:aminomethyltransferase|nr:glycine cleavage system aminomethyltransferase GcvT [Anaerovoracaceae bacterium]